MFRFILSGLMIVAVTAHAVAQAIGGMVQPPQRDWVPIYIALAALVISAISLIWQWLDRRAQNDLD
jgi:hypothetical protein